MSILNISAYRFVPLAQLQDLQAQFRQFCTDQALKGSIVLSEEGINVMLAGQPEAVAAFKVFIERFPAFAQMTYKESLSSMIPFKRLFVKIKRQLTPLGVQVEVKAAEGNHLSPATLKTWLDEEKDFILLDTRNDYEIAHGAFKKATSLHINHFNEFKSAVANLSAEAKTKPLVTYCTGGIRCEKIVPFLCQQGFQAVYQLDGGILQYFHDCGEVHYEGACYVFDERVAIKRIETV